MPLVVPVLRFFVVFFNVYETFKTLKPPPPSARRGGQPSSRALSQRKRDLKGCLAVWVVWCCYAAYERTFDRIVGIFLPFYAEFKSVFLLFLLLTRAKGAEPLFLHVLRPLVKPYAAIVDPMLELSRDIGDFFFALLQVPLDYILSSSWFPSWCTGNSEEELGDEPLSDCISPTDSGNSTHTSKRSTIPILVNRSDAVQTSRVLNRQHGSIRSVSDNQHSSGRLPGGDSRIALHRRSSTTSLPAYSEHPSHDPPRYSQTLSRHNGHQIWYPPAAAYAASGFEVPTSTLYPLGTASEYHSPEWRSYPAFPSAYPPTPLAASASLPSPGTRSSGGNHSVSHSSHPPIPEGGRGFGEMLERVHEGCSDPVHSSSNNDNVFPGVNDDEENSDATRQLDEDTLLDDSVCSSETGLSEDDFGASLRTPHRVPKVMPSSACSSDGLASPLATTGNAPYLRMKVSSDSLSSGSSSLAGRKRTHGTSRCNTQSTYLTDHSRNATLRGKPAPLPPQSSTSEDEDEAEVDGDNGSTKTKRQRVLDPLKRKSSVRPAARGFGNVRKAVVASRNATVRSRAAITASQGIARTKAGSATTIHSTIRAKKPAPGSRPVVHGESRGVIKSSSTSSSQSGTWKGRA